MFGSIFLYFSISSLTKHGTHGILSTLLCLPCSMEDGATAVAPAEVERFEGEAEDYEGEGEDYLYRRGVVVPFAVVQVEEEQ